MNAAMPATPSGSNLWDAYHPTPGHHDEMFSSPGLVRQQWRQFAEQFNLVGHADVKRRWEQAQRLIRENGITFNAYGDQQALRPWRLDAVPLLLQAEEWKSLAAALKQRATLLNIALADLFGPRQLIRDKVLPPQLLFAHPNFYRSYLDLPRGGQHHLTFYAGDLARSPDGRWWVMGDRTRAPSGMGYALENRIATSRILPSIFRNCQVERLAPFFITLRETLQSQAERYQENPRIVLWTRGPESRNYFEDAYLARYLNYTLVESGDLAVRKNRVMLKTLGGLLPVQVIFRRVHDDDCDPVELRADTPSGVAGLVEVIRSGGVSIANSLGTRLVESPAFMAFLPQICRHRLGAELALPSVATWWCGQEEALKYVLAHLDELLIRPAFERSEEAPLQPGQLSKADRQALIARLKSTPQEFVAQERVLRSTTPIMTEDGLQPWHVALRAFLVASGNSYQAMPGGLVRVSPQADVLDWSMTAGERSQDCWVLSPGPIEPVSLLTPQGQTVRLRRSGAELPSRVADNLYWLGRYLERAEGAARLTRTVLLRLTSETQPSTLHEMPALLRALVEQGQIEPGFVVEGFQQRMPDIEQALPEMIFNAQEPRSLRSAIDKAVRLAGIVRDRISVDAWRIVNQIDQRSSRPRRRRGDLEASDVLVLLNHVVLDLSSFAGVVAESMTRTLGWRFLDMGRRVERAMHTSILLQSTLVAKTEYESPVLDAVLEVVDSSMTYRSRYLANLQIAAVLDLLITDETNPRSIGYQLAALRDHVESLPRDQSEAVRWPEERIALSMLNSVRLSDPVELSAAQNAGNRKNLERLLIRLSDQLPKLSEAVANRYLIHVGPLRHFSPSSDRPLP